MDLSIVLVALVLITMIIVPIVILAIIGKSKAEAKLRKLNSYFVKNGFKMSEQEFWGIYSLGIDSISGTVIYIMSGKGDNYVEVIDLNKVKKCSISYSSESLESKNGNELVSDWVGLKIIFNDTQLKNLNLEFFNSDKKSQLDTELELAKKWAEIINRNINISHTIPRH